MQTKRHAQTHLTMIYWQGEKFWLGKFLERPDIMNQGDNPFTGARQPVPGHTEIDNNLARHIRRELGLD